MSDEKPKTLFQALETITNNRKRIERIEDNIDYARFDIQEQRIEALEKKLIEPIVDNQTRWIYVYCDINPDDIKKEIAELRENQIKDWIYISEKISYKDYDAHIHVRKLNLKTGKYSYLTLYFWELNDMHHDIVEDYKK